MIEDNQYGVFDFINKKYGEHISISRPQVMLKNVIFGDMHVD